MSPIARNPICLYGSHANTYHNPHVTKDRTVRNHTCLLSLRSVTRGLKLFCTFSPQTRPTAPIMILSCIIVYCATDGNIYTCCSKFILM
jgi:hypothetical protein